MYSRHAGPTRAHRRSARMSLVTHGGMKVTFSAMLPTAVSKACSHEKPTRMPSASMTAKIDMSTLSSVASRSARISRPRMRLKAMAVLINARTTATMASCSSTRTSLVSHQLRPKKVHQAKHMAQTFFAISCSRRRPWIRLLTHAASTANTQPRPRRMLICKRLWVTSPGSPPSSFGSTPPMMRRNAWMRRKEMVRAMTSFSVSLVFSSHITSKASMF
mmetsp:Transcript_58936/g.132752  ORF Transcript_58936/g.132752 Transcript_58936/m.132752 type:complete len:218 (-) Transcript_58936:222-875(-)